MEPAGSGEENAVQDDDFVIQELSESSTIEDFAIAEYDEPTSSTVEERVEINLGTHEDSLTITSSMETTETGSLDSIKVCEMFVYARAFLVQCGAALSEWLVVCLRCD